MSTPAPMSGRVLGHYRLLEQLGAGGMGVVYRARDEHLHRDVAIKLLPGDDSADPSGRARLLREARAAAALNHPHICTVHEVGEADSQAFIAMELVEGKTLKALLAEDALPPEEVLRYGLQLADALAHAHERGILHRDLKSANVVITPQGRAKVLDFGLAKQMHGAALEEATRSDVSITAPGMLVGTLAYMAPEQMRGQAADARSDLWALGVVLHEAASGALPFQGTTAYELSSAILSQRPTPLPARVPVELRAVIERCLERDPARRYQRAGEARAALEAIQTGAVAPWKSWRYHLARRRTLALSGAVGLSLIIAGGLAIERMHPTPTAGPPHIQSLAVLPLENLSGDPEQAYLAEGVHEGLITDLAKLHGIRVIARSSVMRYVKTGESLAQIAHDLNVDALVTGAVQRSGDEVQVTAHLIDPATEGQLWADRYDRHLRNILSLQNDVVSAITRAISLQLSPGEQAQLARARTVDPKAFDAYLKGRFYMNKMTPDGYQQGLAYMQQAIGLDPGNPFPYAGLALAYCLMGHDRYPDAFNRAETAARKASELGGGLAETQLALGQIRFYRDYDLPAAEPYLRSAVALDPSLAEAHRQYSWYLNAIAHSDEALAEMRAAEETDPLTALYAADLGYQYWMEKEYDRAITEANRSILLDPKYAEGYQVLGDVYADQGMYDQAIAASRKAAQYGPRFTLAITYARAGRMDQARKVIAEVEATPTPQEKWGLAKVYAVMGDKDSAFRWLEAAYQARVSFMPWIRVTPFLEPLHDDPRFTEFARRVKFPAP